MIRKASSTLLALLILAASALAAAAPSALLGEVVGPGAAIDGSPVPSGTTVASGMTVSSTDEPVTVHFRNGTMVRMASQARGRFERSSNSGVRVAVLDGALAFQDSEGQVKTADEGSVIELETDPVASVDDDEEIDICHLVDPLPEEAEIFDLCKTDPNRKDHDEECEWERIEIERDELAQHMAAHPADIPVDDDLRDEWRGEEIDLPGDCRKGFFLIPIWASAGAGTLATGVVLNELIKDDPVVDETALSPVVN